MLVDAFWDDRLKNWGAVYGAHRKFEASSTWALMSRAMHRDPDRELEVREYRDPVDVDDADKVDALLLSPLVDPVGRVFVIAVWAYRYSIGSFGRPKKEVVRMIRETVAVMSRIEKPE